MTHKLAEHLQRAVGTYWNVDCEYNRDGLDKKKLCRFAKNKWNDDTEGSTVLPDIIVHLRGGKGPNLLVIEAKKSGNNQNFDLKKIEGYLKNLRYSYGVLLTFNTGKPQREKDRVIFDRVCASCV